MFHLLIIITLFLGTGCFKTHSEFELKVKTKTNLIKSEVLALDYWTNNKTLRNICKKTFIGEISNVLDYIDENEQGVNLNMSQDENYKEICPQLDKIFNKLPKKINSFLDKYLIAIFLIKGSGSGGYFIEVFDEDINPAGGLILLDLEWLGSNSFNKARLRQFSKKYREIIKFSNTKDVSPKLAFSFFHEVGHLISFIKREPDEYWRKNRDSAGQIKVVNGENELLSILKSGGEISLISSIDPYERLAEFIAMHLFLNIFDGQYMIIESQKPHKIVNFNCLNTDSCKIKKKELVNLLKSL